MFFYNILYYIQGVPINMVIKRDDLKLKNDKACIKKKILCFMGFSTVVILPTLYLQYNGVNEIVICGTKTIKKSSNNFHVY